MCVSVSDEETRHVVAPTPISLGAARADSDRADANQRRTWDVYERLAGYPQPPLPKIPDPGDPFGFQLVQPSRYCRAMRPVYRLLSNLSGFAKFVREIEPHLEEMLRGENPRLALLAAHQYSATLAIEDDEEVSCPFQRAASLVLAACQLREDLVAHRLEPDRLGDQVLEMGQYPNLFGTSVVLTEYGAELFKTTTTSQILVLVRGQFFVVKLGHASPPDATALAEALHRIASTARTITTEPSPAMLTCGELVDQIDAFSIVRTDPENGQNLETMKHSLLTLCLDLEASPHNLECAAHAAHVGNMANRWWHSSLQLVVFANSRACAIHSFAANLDGNVMMRSTQELAERASVIARRMSATPTGSPLPFQRLTWHVRESTLQKIRLDLLHTTDDQQATFHLEGLGQDYFRNRGLAPVPAFIVALQLTVQQLVGRTPTIYQFLSQSSYRCTGLRVVNVATREVARLWRLMKRGPLNSTNGRSLLEQAIECQNRVCRQARPYLPLEFLIVLWIKRHARALWCALLMNLLLGRSQPDVMVSHPAISPKVPIGIGRPGAKLTYVKHFGLHYQIHADRTTVTCMPGVKWSTPNRDLIQRLAHNLAALPGQTTARPGS